ncbi:unnamed protein product [Paramecium pentaurelia]|uniref:Uncharacterized protein n=1 Tax=Paramecium pentaurelia TaxID=43138 RepID=A0A8S1WZV2_9CILI|nr:unnamed protein product [Paramecium pentaurelia]
MFLEIILLLCSSSFALLFQVDELGDQIHDCAKLFIFGTLITEFPWMMVGIITFVWIKECLRSKDLHQQEKHQANPAIIIHHAREGATATSTENVQPAIEAVQIFDYATGESQYAFIQKTDKSLLTQLGVTLKNTILLEKGRQQDTSINSKLISHLDQQKRANAQNISIIYEDNSEYQQNQLKPHVSIPFKIGDFDKQMGEIIQAEILSGEYPVENKEINTKLKYEQALISIIIILVIPQIESLIFRLVNSILFGVVLHSAVQRKEILTVSHIIYLIILLTSCVVAYIFGLYYQSIYFRQTLLGCLLWSFQHVNPNLCLLVFPIPTLLFLAGL